MELYCYPQKKTVRTFEIEAISIPIVYNKYGDYDPNGLLYVLKKDAKKVREKALENFHKEVPQPYEGVKPLVLRAIDIHSCFSGISGRTHSFPHRNACRQAKKLRFHNP